MSDQKKLELKNRQEFIQFIDSFAKISDSFIADLSESKISVVTTTADTTLIAYGEYDCECNSKAHLNIPDSKKLVRVLETVNQDNIVLSINTNNLEYKGSNVKFKYHLFEDGFLKKPPLSIDRLKSFDTNVSFNLTKQQLQSLIKASTFATETNKLYLYTDNGKLIGELTDKARHNSDSYCVTLAEVDFELSPISINFDNIRLLSLHGNCFNIKINTKVNVLVIETNHNSVKLSYFITSLTQ